MKKKGARTTKINLPVIIGLAALGAIAGALYYFTLAEKSGPSLTVYFSRGERLAPVRRPLRPEQAPLKAALAELLAGPSPAERAQGIETLIPPGTRTVAVKTEGQTALIVFNRKLENYGGGSARVEGMIAQIVYTATEVPGVAKVWIKMSGEKELVLGGEGLVIDRPLSRGEVGR